MSNGLVHQHKWIFPCKITRVIDGDTVRALVDHGWRNYSERSIRLAAVDTPEKYTGDAEEKALGIQASQLVEEWVLEHFDHCVNGYYYIHTDSDKTSFGRYVALDLQCGEGHSLVDFLLDLGYEA